MIQRIAIASTLAALFAAVPMTAHAGTSCKSTWVKSTSKIAKFYVPVGKFVCKQANTEDEAAAKKCIEDLEKFAKTAKEIKDTWNEGEDGSWKIGPRALPLNRPQTGAVSTERQFVGTPVVNEEFTLELERTGGKAKKNLTAKICFVDENGDDVAQETVVLSKDGRKSFKKTFKGVEGTVPLIHLNNQRWGANAHKYKIKSSGKGEAANVQQARQTMKAASKSKGKSKPRPGIKPSNRRLPGKNR
ncbi:MAG: hypothetical protein ACE37F_24090 [Nannocystaceae bacterium]|nr:hypothetical protein [bacterium]